jgi:hypothetical protein
MWLWLRLLWALCMSDGLQPLGADLQYIDVFLDNFSHKCVEFGYYCDQYMREEINLGQITHKLSEATGEGESFFSVNHAMMTPQQYHRFETMQRSLDQMTVQLIETEIRRNRHTVEEAIRNGEYFLVNITQNSIQSSIYIAYNNPSEHSRRERDARLAELQQERELAQALIKVLKVIEAKIAVESYNEQEYHKIQKAFQIYVEYFKNTPRQSLKQAADRRAIRLLEQHVAQIEAQKFGGDRRLSLQHVSACAALLNPIADAEERMRLENLRERVRPPDPRIELQRLFSEVEQAEGESNIYSAVVAFNNFAEEHSGEPAVHDYKRRLRLILHQKGML